MKGYNEIADAKRLVEQYGPEVAQEIIASYMRDRGMQEGVDMLAGLDVRKAQRSLKPADLSDGMAGAPQTPVGDDLGLGVNPYPGAGTPGYDRSFTSREIAGQRAAEEAAMESQRAQWTEERNANIGAKYGPAARQIAEAGDAEGVTDYAATQTPAEKARNAERRRYEMDAREQGSARLPNGDYVSAARNELREQDNRGAEARKEFRKRAATTASGNMPSEKQRWENYSAQMMLAGSNPRKNMVNAWSMMNDPGVSDQQRRSLQYMLPGGQLAASVDANANQQAFELAKQMAIGAGFQDPNSPAAKAAAQALEAKRRQENPEAAGASDLSSGNPTSTQAQAEVDRLAKSMDNDFGGFSYESEIALAQRLQQPPYNMRQPEAEAAAHRAAENRRWWWNQGGSPQKPATPGNDPAAWGAAPPAGPTGA
jgi:hypothetical protein